MKSTRYGLAVLMGLLFSTGILMADDGASVTVTPASPNPDPVCAGSQVNISATSSVVAPADTANELTIFSTNYVWTAVDDAGKNVPATGSGPAGSITWVSSGCGTRTITITNTVTFTGTNINGNYTNTAAGSTSVSVDVITAVRINSLVFSQNTDFINDYNHTISAGSQVWSPGNNKTSALYTQSGGKIAVDAHLGIDCPLSSPATMTIVGVATSDAGVQFTLGSKTFQFPANTTIFTVSDIESDNAFGANFDFIGSIQWTITYGTCSYQITSDNNIYYVPNDVQPDKQIDTVMYVVCRAMSGKPYQDSGALWSALVEIWTV